MVTRGNDKMIDYKIINSLIMKVIRWLAKDEYKIKSDRVKTAVRKVNGVTKSYKGNKWGRKNLLNVDKQILELRGQGKTMRQISEEVYYWDKNNHKKFVSVGYIHKTITNQESQNYIFVTKKQEVMSNKQLEDVTKKDFVT